MKLTIIILMILFNIKSNSQQLSGYYDLIKKTPKIPPKETFSFLDSNGFKYQAHFTGIILIGEGVFKIDSDSLVLIFNNCNNCIKDSLDSALTAPANFKKRVFIKHIDQWNLDVLGIVNERKSFKVESTTKGRLILRDENAVTTFRIIPKSKEKEYLNSFEKYFKH